MSRALRKVKQGVIAIAGGRVGGIVGRGRGKCSCLSENEFSLFNANQLVPRSEHEESSQR